jgi:hypothetical protein
VNDHRGSHGNTAFRNIRRAHFPFPSRRQKQKRSTWRSGAVRGAGSAIGREFRIAPRHLVLPAGRRYPYSSSLDRDGAVPFRVARRISSSPLNPFVRRRCTMVRRSSQFMNAGGQ